MVINIMIKCRQCLKLLPKTRFYSGRRKCKSCHSKRMKEYRRSINYNKVYYEQNKNKEKNRCLENYYKNKDNPDKKLKWRENQLKVKYNITLEEWNKMYKDQNYSCAICKSDELVGSGVLHVDHCHVTGSIRGLLCHHCNVALGSFKDNVNILNNAIKYLKKILDKEVK